MVVVPNDGGLAASASLAEVAPPLAKRQKLDVDKENLEAPVVADEEPEMAEEIDVKAEVHDPKKAAKEKAKAEKAAAKEVEKQRKKEAKQLEKERKAAEKEAEKERNAALKKYAMLVGNAIKNYVQAREKSLTCKMNIEQFDYVFAKVQHLMCDKTITTVCRYPDGTTKTYVEEVPKNEGLVLSESQVQEVFGMGKTKGGSFNRWHGATTWNIVRMTVKHNGNKVELKWSLSEGADWSR